MREEPEYSWKDTLSEIKGGICRDDDDEEEIGAPMHEGGPSKGFIICAFLAVLTLFGIAGVKLIQSFY